VRAALADAVCRGALPLAAAGNQDWGPEPSSGPLLPAGWETLPAPTDVECRALGIEPPAGYGRGGYRPLVHAIGAVGAAGRRLPLARRDAEPRLVAFGDHGLVVTPEEAEALTGSSVATLVTSAAAAALWSRKPELSAFEVAEGLFEASAAVAPERRASFGLGDQRAPVRRLFACPAARAAGATGVRCPDYGASPLPGPEDGRLARLLDDPNEMARALPTDVQQIDLGSVARTVTTAEGCPPTVILDSSQPESSRERLRAAGGRRIRCPQWQAPAPWANAWVAPQPGSNQCSTCGIEDGSPIGRAYLEIDPLAARREAIAQREGVALPPPVLSDPVLKVGDTVYYLDGLDLTAPRPIRALITSIPLGDDPPPVFFSLLVDGRLSSNSLLLGPEAVVPH
jgi:hypothetical protein